MPNVLRAQVVLNSTKATDLQIVNTWHAITLGATTPVTAATSFVASLRTFYEAIDTHLSDYLAGDVPVCKVWDYIDPKPRQPIYTDTFSALSTSSTRLPNEVACCVSYRGTYTSGVSPKSKRGRIYIGPLSSTAVSTSTGLFTSSFRDAIALAADNLLTASDASTEWHWVVYSPTLDVSENGQTLGCTTTVTEGWVDEAPDIQRRRGVVALGKSTFT